MIYTKIKEPALTSWLLDYVLKAKFYYLLYSFMSKSIDKTQHRGHKFHFSGGFMLF